MAHTVDNNNIALIVHCSILRILWWHIFTWNVFCRQTLTVWSRHGWKHSLVSGIMTLENIENIENAYYVI